jgi:two-component system nitrate/nitrite response regulator NarP
MAKLGIVDDHPLFLEGLEQYLTAHGHEIAMTAKSVAEAMAALATTKVDVLILDVSMKDGGGLDILSSLRAAGCDQPVIFLTVSMQPEQVVRAMPLNISGIVLKDSDPSTLLTCIDAVLRGETQIDGGTMERALRYSLARGQEASPEGSVLTNREREIVTLIREGLRNRAIAERCGVSEGTVKVHLHSIFRKLGVQSRAELIVYGQEGSLMRQQ